MDINPHIIARYRYQQQHGTQPGNVASQTAECCGPLYSECSLLSCLQVVGAPSGFPTARHALVYKLRACDTAVLDLYAALSKHYQHTSP